MRSKLYAQTPPPVRDRPDPGGHLCPRAEPVLSGGESAVEVSAGWSVGPSSRCIETFAGLSLGGCIDVGLGISRYTYTFDDGFESEFTEYALFVRYFPLKQQQDRSPVP